MLFLAKDSLKRYIKYNYAFVFNQKGARIMSKLSHVLETVKHFLFRLDEVLHVVVAILLIALVFSMAFYTVTHFKVYSPEMVLKVIDDIILMLIILELL